MMRPLFRIALALAAGTLVPSTRAAEPVAAAREDRQAVFRAGDRVIVRYQAEPGDLPRPDIAESFRRGGYFHSLTTLRGRLVTDDFPPDHMHHHAVWMAWTKTRFDGRTPDFWNMGQKLGRVEFEGLDALSAAEGIASLTARHRYVDLTARPPAVALSEVWEAKIRVIDATAWALDLTATHTCATGKPLELPEYHYGGLGFRGNRAWNGAENLKVLTSQGITDRIQANTSRERWCWLGGTVDGETAGVAILGHPDNFRAPQPVRVHPTEPFFCFAPQQGGTMAIEPGKPYRVRYRLIIADGEPGADRIEEWWRAWTTEPSPPGRQ